MKLAGSSVAIRADASRRIGSGHLMRGLTLADALRERGANCIFAARRGDGDMLSYLQARGYATADLPPRPDGDEDADDLQRRDAMETLARLPSRVDLLVCDHYDLSDTWQLALRAQCDRLMVIDDLANRDHDCDLLLDQNLGRVPADYASRVPGQCRILAGPAFAVLRPQFAAARSAALERRARTGGALIRLMISLGGVDEPNATCKVLEVIESTTVGRTSEIVVLLGAGAPWIDEVKALAARSVANIQVHVGVSDVAALLQEADLAIGAAGGSSWERCCLGVPALLIVLADNQRPGARALESAGAAVILGELSTFTDRLCAELEGLHEDPASLRRMSEAAAAVTDGLGVVRVAHALEQL